MSHACSFVLFFHVDMICGEHYEIRDIYEQSPHPSAHMHEHECTRGQKLMPAKVPPKFMIQNVLQLKPLVQLKICLTIKSIMTRRSKLDLMLVCSVNYF